MYITTTRNSENNRETFQKSIQKDNTNPKQKFITPTERLSKMMPKMGNNKAPGRDNIN